MSGVVKRLRTLRAEFEVRFTGAFADNAINTVDAAQAEIATLRAELAEMKRRRDEWQKKAEGFDTIRHALREKVGAPWPPNLSRGLWAALAADEKKRADDAEAELAAAREALGRIADMTDIEADFDGFEARDIARAMLAAAPMRGEG